MSETNQEHSLAGIASFATCTAAFVLPDFLTYVREQRVALLFKPLDTQVLSRQVHTLLTSA